MKVLRWVSKAKEVLSNYESYLLSVAKTENPLPFHLFLQQYFKKNKNIGSKDRKAIRHLSYAYFRTVPFFSEQVDIELIFKIGIFLSAKTSNGVEDELLKHFLPEAYTLVDTTNTKEKLAYAEKVHPSFSVNNFKSHSILKEIIIDENMLYYFFNQPLLFIRVKTGKMYDIEEVLSFSQVLYTKLKNYPNTLAFENGTDLSVLNKYKGTFEVQDLSSQHCIAKIPIEKNNEKWWDCCSGAGGKSLAILDKYPDVDLTISDRREGIIKNLNERLRIANHKKTEGKVIDLQKNIPFEKNSFDGILADVPCSGSGTWGRNPENYQKSLEDCYKYPEIQKSILQNIHPYLKKGGKLMYITCSLFKFENDEVVKDFANKNDYTIKEINYFHGFEKNADSMFFAVMEKN